MTAPAAATSRRGASTVATAPTEVCRSVYRDKAMARVVARWGGARVARPSAPTTRPTVTVLIPCYNYGRFLPACVDSVLTQPGVDVDVVIVDDCSTDGSGEVAERLAARDERVRLIRHRSNQGHIATYNEAIEAVTGSYMLLLSADDLVTPGALGRATALMEHHPNVGLTYGRALEFNSLPLPSARTAVTYWSIWPGAVWLRRRFSLAMNTVHCPTVVVRTDLQKELGGYKPSLPHSGDLEMWLRFATASDVGFVGGAEQAYYRIHGSNMSATTYTGGLTDLRQRHEAFETILPLLPSDVAQELSSLSRRSLAGRAVELAAEARRSGDARIDAMYLDLARDLWAGARDLPEWRLLGSDRARPPAALRAAKYITGRLRNHMMWEQTHWYGG